MTVGQDLQLDDGRSVRVYDTGGGNPSTGLALLWHHGSPQTGAPLEPLLTAAGARGIRLFSYARPSYGGSSPQPGRTVASAAADVAQVADALGVDRFAVMGASGGGPHAMACAALLSDRVVGVVALAGLAPFTESFDWYAGMVAPDGLRSAAAGREARQRFAESDEFDEFDEFDENSFIAADWAALAGAWAALGRDAGQADAAGPDGLIDDDVAFVTPWGFDVTQIEVPLLIVQGGLDRVVPPSHADWLVENCPTSECWRRPRDGHVSVLGAVPVAMDWLRGDSRAA